MTETVQDAAPDTTSSTSDQPAWGRLNGFVALGNDGTALDERQVMDRLLILNAVSQYGWTYDERDVDAMERGFTEDIVFDGNVGGTFAIEPVVGRDAVTAWLQGHMDSQAHQRRHNVTNQVVVAQTDDTASVNTYLLLTEAVDGAVRVVTSGFYRFDLVRGETGWMISHIFGGFDAPF